MSDIIDDKTIDNKNLKNECFLQGVKNADKKSEVLRPRVQWKYFSWWLLEESHVLLRH